MALNIILGVINPAVVIVLFIITYRTIDKRNIKKEENKKDIKIFLLCKSYDACIWWTEKLTGEIIEKYIIPKIDFNKGKDIIVENMQNAPFSNENAILKLMMDGQISKKEMEEYFEVSDMYRKYMSTRITFFDAECMYQPLQIELINKATEAKNNIIK